MSQCFPPYKIRGGDIKVRLDLSNYETKTDNFCLIVSSFASKINPASLKTKLDKLDIDKLKPISNDLAKLSNAVKNDILKKTEYNSLKTSKSR